MKRTILKLYSLPMLATLMLMGATLQTQAQFPINASYVNNFSIGANTTPFAGSGSVASWIYWYNTPGGNTPITNDVNTPDPLGGAGAGSLEIENPFTATGTQNLFFGTFGNGGGYDFSVVASLLSFDTVSFDVYVGTNQISPPDANGNWGTLGVGIVTTGYSYQGFANGSVTIPGAASNGWVHLSVPIDHTLSGITTVAGIGFDYANYGGYPKTNLTFWVGNLVVHYAGAPPAPPTLSLAKPIAGLNVIDSSAGINDRESIMSTITSGISWVGSAAPVTYSLTITNYPNSATYQGFASYIFLIPGPYDAAGAQAAPYANIPSYETAPDYNETNVVFLDIENGTYYVTNGANITTNQGAVTYFRYKVNEPNGNSMIYGGAPYTNAPGSGSANFGSGVLGSVASPSAVGTWSITFNNNNVTMTAPNGSNTSFTMPAADAAVFSDANGFTFLIGSQPNSTSAIGQRVVFSEAKIQGSSTLLDDQFLNDTTLNTNLWTVLASAPAGILVVPTNTAYFVNWTVPDVGFSLQVGTNLASATSWTDSTLTPAGQIGRLKETLVPQSSLPVGNAGFYRLIQRTFTQLQVLLPGETNAPGTANGKIGTPTPVSLAANTPTTITVNAVDSTYHIISGVSDVIHITSSDGSAFTPIDTGMVNGTLVLSGSNGLLFQTQGSQTVTATDKTTVTIPAATSSAVTVGP